MSEANLDNVIATFRTRHGDSRTEFQLYNGRLVMKYSGQAGHLNDRSFVNGEQTILLSELKLVPATGTIKIRRTMILVMTLMAAVGVVMGTQRFQESHGHTPSERTAFIVLMSSLIVAIIAAVAFAWKTVKFRSYSYQTGAFAFSVVQGVRRENEFEQFCNQLESAIMAAQAS